MTVKGFSERLKLARIGPTHRRVQQPGRARNRQGASQAGSCQTANDGSDKSGMGVPRSIETRNKTHAGMGLRWNETKKKEEYSFAHQDGKRPRKGPLFGGARLTIEPGSDFPIGVKHQQHRNKDEPAA